MTDTELKINIPMEVVDQDGNIVGVGTHEVTSPYRKRVYKDAEGTIFVPPDAKAYWALLKENEAFLRVMNKAGIAIFTPNDFGAVSDGEVSDDEGDSA